MPSDIVTISRNHLDGIMRLKAAAGWNQTAEDWKRLLALSPDGCFGVLEDGVLAASGTTISYGQDLAWIGMMLTLPEYRRRGFARLLMEHALAFLEHRGVRCIGLDATDMGRPLYESLGFRAECAVERWVRPPEPLAGNWGALPCAAEFSLDREEFGADRGPLLEHLAGESAAAPGGYAMARPGSLAAYFGPCMAETSQAAENLLCWCLTRHGATPVYWDLFPRNRDAVRLAETHGFQRARVLQRMFYRDARVQWNSSRMFAIAGLEYG